MPGPSPVSSNLPAAYYVEYVINTHIINSNFTTNKADYGGAVFAGHNAEVSEISNSTFISNTATYNGGAVDWLHPTVTS